MINYRESCAFSSAKKRVRDVYEATKYLIEYSSQRNYLENEIVMSYFDTLVSALCEIVAELVRSLVKENSSTAQSQEEHLKKYDSLNKRYADLICELEKQKEKRTSRQQKDKAMSLFIRTLKKSPLVLEEWDDTIWTVMVEKGIVGKNGGIRIVFYNGMEIEVGGEK